jgi:predicted dithiol-disulfide oxidoreductase (DUF899 family)
MRIALKKVCAVAGHLEPDEEGRLRVEADYVFDTPQGRKSLAELFENRSQLVAYHFMLGPGCDAGCMGCSFLADHLDTTLPHLNHHDVTHVTVSRAPLPEIEAYKRHMGWRFPWASSFGNSFNADYSVSFKEEEFARRGVLQLHPNVRRASLP